MDLASSRGDGANHFHRIPPNCLVQVVLRIECTIAEGEVRAAPEKGGHPCVSILRARRCLTRFKVLI